MSYLNTAKPDLGESLLTIGVATVLGLASALPMPRRERAQEGSAGCPASARRSTKRRRPAWTATHRIPPVARPIWPSLRPGGQDETANTVTLWQVISLHDRRQWSESFSVYEILIDFEDEIMYNRLEKKAEFTDGWRVGLRQAELHQQHKPLTGGRRFFYVSEQLI